MPEIWTGSHGNDSYYVNIMRVEVEKNITDKLTCRPQLSLYIVSMIFFWLAILAHAKLKHMLPYMMHLRKLFYLFIIVVVFVLILVYFIWV